MRRLGVAVLVVCCAGGWIAVDATNLPPGFEDTVVVDVPFPDNFAQLTWTPDGDLILADKYGQVLFFDMESKQLREIAYLVVSADGERGINGLAADPDYVTNRHVWLYYATPAPHHNRLSRFTFDGQALVDETVIVKGPLVQHTDHNAGCLRFAPDKTLFVSIGDDFQGSTTAQDPFDLRGKILHLNRDGTPVADNPFRDGAAGHPLVWALGLRNPYRISIQPVTGNLFITDVGFAAWEELNLGLLGANYGWAAVEGPNPPGREGVVYPIYTYSHDGEGAAIIGGDHVGPGDFAPQYEGDYFYHEFVRRELWRVDLENDTTVVGAELFATDFGQATDLQFGPDGALYYVCRTCGPAAIRRIAYVGGANTQPVAEATATPSSGPAPLTVDLDGSASFDSDGDTLDFEWNLGDGGSTTDAQAVHPYPQGVYQARLTVSDGRGGTDSSPELRIVAGNSPPQVELLAPTEGGTYVAGQTIEYRGRATDPEDGASPCSRFAWQVLFHHNTHTHPFLGPLQGNCDGTFQTPLRGESDPDQGYEIVLTVGDSGQPLGAVGKLTTTRSLQIRPQVSTMNFTTSPVAGLELALDTVPFSTPRAVAGIVNITHRIEAGALLRGPDNLLYRWRSWSDGGARAHDISTPPSDTTYTATYDCVPFEVQGLRLERTADRVRLSWAPAALDCLAAHGATYRVYAAATARPASGTGTFPVDPAFREVGTTRQEEFTYRPDATDRYFLVVAISPANLDGAAGHYGF